MCAAFPDHHVTEPLVESLRFDKGADGARAIAPLAHVLDGLDQRGDGHAPPRGEGAEPLPCLRIKADAGFAAADDHRMFARACRGGPGYDVRTLCRSGGDGLRSCRRMAALVPAGRRASGRNGY